MRARDGLALLAAVALLAAPAMAHGALPDDVADPLEREVGLWLDAQRNLATAAPADGGVTLPADGASARWTLTVPIAGTAALTGLEIMVEADGLVVPRSDDNAIIEVVATVDDAVVEESRLTFEGSDVLSGERTFTAATWVTGLDVDRGATVGVAVAFLGTSTGDVRVVAGDGASRLLLGLTSPDLDALDHGHDGWTHRLATDAPEPDGLILDVELRHAGIQPTTLTAAVGDEVVVRIDNAETESEAAAHGPWGVDAPHRVRLAGLGLDETLGVYAGEVLYRTLRAAAAGNLTLTCADGCEGTGEAVLTVVEEVRGIEDEVVLEPDRFHEVNLHLDEGAELTWRFATSPPSSIKYDVHSHRGGEVVVHAEGTADAANGTFTAPAAGTYSLLLENVGSAATTVVYEVVGGTPVEVEAPEEGFLAVLPAPALLLLISAVAFAARTRRRGR